VGTHTIFLSLQSQFCKLKEALRNRNSTTFLKEMLLPNRNPAIPQFQKHNFFMKSKTSSPQLESFISAIFGIFLAVE
jgi:hypothetical protein